MEDIFLKRSLIVIDMQLGSFSPYDARHDAKGVIARINRLARKVRTAEGSVIFVQHDGPPGDPHHPDAPGWHLLPDLQAYESDLFVRKSACDAFLHTNLSDHLRSPTDQQLIITGCATEFCVDTTVRSALAQSYRTIVPSDTHTTANRSYLSAEKIIEHHNAVWSAFLSPVGPATVCASSEIAFN
jgi:nicotinamidase-related amidase